VHRRDDLALAGLARGEAVTEVQLEHIAKIMCALAIILIAGLAFMAVVGMLVLALWNIVRAFRDKPSAQRSELMGPK